MLKRILSFLLCAIFAVSLFAGCATDVNVSDSDTDQVSASASSSDTGSDTDVISDSHSSEVSATETQSETDTEVSDTDSEISTDTEYASDTESSSSDEGEEDDYDAWKDRWSDIEFITPSSSAASTSSKNTSTSSKNTGSSSGSSSNTGTPEAPKDDNLKYNPSQEHCIVVTGTDAYPSRVVVYDLNKANSTFTNLADCVKWEWKGYETYGDVSGVKFRYSSYDRTDVVLITQSGGAYDGSAEIIRYSDKKTILRMKGIYNAHSAEMLPDGSVVVAASGHDTNNNYSDGGIHYFPAGSNFESSFYSLPFAHGVVWDPDAGHLWAVGFAGVVALKIENGRLVKIPGKGYSTSNFTGHDLVSAFGQPGKYWVSNNSCVYLFDSANGTMNLQSGAYAAKAVKGIAYFSDGTMIYTIDGLNGGESYASKGFRIITAGEGTDFKTFNVKVGSSQFYKVHTFTKNYN